MRTENEEIRDHLKYLSLPVSYTHLPVRRAGHCGKGGGLSGPVRCARPGGHRCALGAGVHGVGGYRGAAGRSV